MEVNKSNRWDVLKVAGLVGAVFLIAFGGVENFVRTVKFGIEKLFRS